MSLSDGIACYRLNGIRNNGSYGYCRYDENYTPVFSANSQTWIIDEGFKGNITNSKCYTIVAPIFDYALPFSDGWGAVCKGNKWSYVSADGLLMCDFAFDSAYPFKNGRAKVICNGECYTISTTGEGIPSFINRDTYSLELEIATSTIEQLYHEGQYEKAIEWGNKFYNEITYGNGQIIDVTANQLSCAIRSEFIAMAAQNSLMSLTVNAPELWNYYQNLSVTRRFSYKSECPQQNRCNAEYFFEQIKKKYQKDVLLESAIQSVQSLHFKSAILQFESWLKERDIPISQSPLETVVYYYLAVLSDDFETANELLVDLAELHEKGAFVSLKDDYCFGLVLAEIMRYESAERCFLKASKQKGDIRKSILCYYNLALVYISCGLNANASSYYERCLELIKNDKNNSIPIELKNEIMVDCLSFIIQNNLLTKQLHILIEEYVRSEVLFNTELFSSNGILFINRVWGKSLFRINKFLKLLPNCDDAVYRKHALTLAVFEQSIAHDTERQFLSCVNNSGDKQVALLFSEYLKMKRDNKGIDIFALDESDDNNNELAILVNNLEAQIKKLLAKDLSSKIGSSVKAYFSIPNTLGKNDVAINVIGYTDETSIKYCGVLITRGGDNEIVYVPLGKEAHFKECDFWPSILGNYSISVQDNCYLYAGNLEEKGLEYEICDDGQIAYLKYNIHRVSSLANIKDSGLMLSTGRLALFGGLFYGEDITASRRGAVDSGYLEYSKKEIDAIESLMKEEMAISSFAGEKGTIKQFLNLDTIPHDVIHLATHGFQNDLKSREWNPYRDRFDYYRQNTDVESEEWLMNNTGLFFSISDKDTVNVILSREVSCCDLQATKLVVLSACSTVAGKSSDLHFGSISLTTAFTIAGAQNIITSLKDVEDEKTFEFMTLFYRELKGEKDIFVSFRNTVRTMYTNYKDNKDFWGSFVLVEN